MFFLLCVFLVVGFLQGVVCCSQFCTFIDFNFLMACALLLVFFTVPCLLLLSLCVDGELVCAEGYTQVTGVLAMMMTGRVLLVCALCVLWCGIAGGGCDEEATEGLGNGVQLPPESKALETSPQDQQGLHDTAAGVKGKLSPANSTLTEDEDDDEDEEEEEEEEEDDSGAESEPERRTEGQGVQEGTVALGSDSTKQNLSGGGQRTGQPIVSTGSISTSDSQESNAILTQKEVEGKTDTDGNPTTVQSALTTDNGRNTLPAGIAEGNPPSPSEDDVDSREQDAEDTTIEDNKNVPSTETAATPQSHRPKGTEGTGEDA
ncbi:mucin-associated surface protein (MASP), putative, partial [Trypanosoma cruzi marinkellei]